MKSINRLLGPLSLYLVVAALLVAGAAIDRLLQVSLFSDTNASTTGEAEVRISATPRTDGSVRVGLQQQGDDGSWGEVRYPEISVVPADAEPNRRLYSSALTVSTSGDVYTLADAYYEYGVGISQSDQLPPEPTVWCLLQGAAANQAGRGLCQGLVDGFGEQSVEIIEYEEIAAGVGQVVGRIASGENPDLVGLSRLEEIFGLLVGLDSRFRFPLTAFPLHSIDPEPASGATYCLIGHGLNSFWQMLFNAAQAGGSHLGVNTILEVYEGAEERAAKIRECAADEVAAIAVTLAETEHVADATREARAQGVPVVTYNSGASDAQAAGSLLHVGLDDRKAGEIVGERLTADGVQGAALCLIHEAQNVGLTERCDGLDETYGTVEMLSVVDGFAPLSERLAEGDVGAVVLLNAGDVIEVVGLIDRSESSPPLVVIGFDTRLAHQMLTDRVAFAVWDHGPLQGYLAVALAALADSAFLVPDLMFNGAQLLIEPSIITAEAMKELLARAGG
jgi:simple sugar transport system substrate-binding protein